MQFLHCSRHPLFHDTCMMCNRKDVSILNLPKSGPTYLHDQGSESCLGCCSLSDRVCCCSELEDQLLRGVGLGLSVSIVIYWLNI